MDLNDLLSGGVIILILAPVVLSLWQLSEELQQNKNLYDNREKQQRPTYLIIQPLEFVKNTKSSFSHNATQ